MVSSLGLIIFSNSMLGIFQTASACNAIESVSAHANAVSRLKGNGEEKTKI
jgi:hypothetical protein